MAITTDDIILSLIAAFMGLAVSLPVTYLIVDRVVKNRQKKELAPVERTAIQRLRTKLGTHYLTNYLVTIVVEITKALEERRAIPQEVAESYALRLKDSQNDIEMILDIYNQVLTTKIKDSAGAVILQIEHLQEDFEYLAQIYPKPITTVLGSHIQETILKTVRLVKEVMRELGADNIQIKALEEWLIQFKNKPAVLVRPEPPIEISGGHEIS